MTTFKEMGLSQEIYKSIDELGFHTPTLIQEKTIPAILKSKRDLVALAHTGTGKTAAFGLPIIQQADTSQPHTQALILCPTRELCLQISKDIEAYAKFTKKLSVLPVYGGTHISPQLKALKSGVHIVVGTPGRTLDLIKRKALHVGNIQWLILDEADEMLDMGFKEELDEILSVTPPHRQTLLFSATMLQGVRRIANAYMNDPEEISAGKINSGADNVTHQYYMVKASNRYLALKRLADVNPKIYGIVFCRTRKETKEVADKLIQDGYNADALHGDLSQAQRDQVMQHFRSKHLQLLIATDVAARGLDVNDLTHIINYNLPDDPEVYIHRSGRTGRAGKKGIAISIVHSREGSRIRTLEKTTGKKFAKHLVPGGREICEKRLFNLVDKVEKVVVDEKQIESFLPDIYKKLEWLDRNQLIKQFISVEFNRFLEYYKDAEDLNVSSDEKKSKNVKEQRNQRSRAARGTDNIFGNDFTRFHLNIGSKNKATALNIIGLINEATKTRHIDIGKIDIFPKFSFFEVGSAHENLILKAFQNKTFDGIPLDVSISKKDASSGHYDKSTKNNRKTKKGREDNNRKHSSSRSKKKRRF